MEREKYPYLYEIADLDPGESWKDCINPGWHARFLKAMDCINEILAEDALWPSTLAIDQLKEKFGAVRMYWHLHPTDGCANAVARARIESEIEAIIAELSSETEHICCECGQPATHLSTGWVLPYCRPCAERLQAAANARHKTNFPFEMGYRPIPNGSSAG